ncbi:hypothetical protein PgNI_06149 [Pyricularia grisea]|uniref:Uncharacterized protein n=1 Tax=Pyricularia grisea TaxID=148305 RepID=A0A6P8B5Y2_PYRGI|nr:hypothetical protein PgNI_06149 [Pyricularia grisea]TLD10534.1 hypothetical protein PgNI_06149 [Pyricularia grisea]
MWVLRRDSIQKQKAILGYKALYWKERSEVLSKVGLARSN